MYTTQGGSVKCCLPMIISNKMYYLKGESVVLVWGKGAKDGSTMGAKKSALGVKYFRRVSAPCRLIESIWYCFYYYLVLQKG